MVEMSHLTLLLVDVIAQNTVDAGKPFDWRRFASVATFGVLMMGLGNFQLLRGYEVLFTSARFGGRKRVAAAKTACDQVPTRITCRA